MARIDGLRRENWPDQFMHSWQLYPLLSKQGLMESDSRLRDEGGQCMINGVPVEVRSVWAARALAQHNGQPFVHRVFAVCDCGRRVPFGRLSQHRKVCHESI